MAAKTSRLAYSDFPMCTQIILGVNKNGGRPSIRLATILLLVALNDIK